VVKKEIPFLHSALYLDSKYLDERHVRDDGRRLLRLLHILYRLRDRTQLLADQPFRGRHRLVNWSRSSRVNRAFDLTCCPYGIPSVYTFRSILDDTKRSAFAFSAWVPYIVYAECGGGLTSSGICHSLAPILEEVRANGKSTASESFSRVTTFKKVWAKTKLFWVALVVVDIGFQAAKRADMSQASLDFLGSSLASQSQRGC
jgi:hypothetical protein